MIRLSPLLAMRSLILLLRADGLCTMHIVAVEPLACSDNKKASSMLNTILLKMASSCGQPLR
jgi:hypothetical protein